jgi:hypothetical protein
MLIRSMLFDLEDCRLAFQAGFRLPESPLVPTSALLGLLFSVAHSGLTVDPSKLKFSLKSATATQSSDWQVPERALQRVFVSISRFLGRGLIPRLEFASQIHFLSALALRPSEQSRLTLPAFSVE